VGQLHPAIREVEPALRDYLGRLGERVPIEAAVVFGSRARGEGFRDSDVDLAVVSGAFEGMSRFDRIYLLQEGWQGPVALEPLGFTPEEFLACDHLLLWEVLHVGVALQDRGVFAAARATLRQHIATGELTPLPYGWRCGEHLAGP